jgi:hypothetical protein
VSDDLRQIKVIKVVQELVADDDAATSITPALLAEKVDAVLRMNPRWRDGLSVQAVLDELIRRFSVRLERDTSLHDDDDHENWLDGARQQGWKYWQRYREWLERSLPWDVVDGLDRSTNDILKRLEDPNRSGSWSRRGLVVGHVQSGKTGNFTGLINKAADANYKIIIVLSGLHNNLRSQTQLRLEEGFLGYQTDTRQDLPKPIGVGLIDSDSSIAPNCATTRADSGDFSKVVARRLAIAPEARPWLFVVKKNKTVLSDLLRWIQTRVADLPVDLGDGEAGDPRDLPLVRKRVTQLPLLIIDDEADNGSVDTKEQLFVDGKPDEEHSPTTINKLIRRILNSFTRSAYVGYTATPFANIFIHERGSTRQEGADLFPSAFIHSLSAPSNYVGPSRIFSGKGSVEGRAALPVVRTVGDYCSDDGRGGWMPPRHDASHVPFIEEDGNLPKSLVEAIDSFLIACAIRNIRGQRAKHASMLVHVTRYTMVQTHLYTDIETHVRRTRQRLARGLADEATTRRLRALWDADFVANERAFQGVIDGEECVLPSWESVLAELVVSIADIDVKMINGKAKDALDYVDGGAKGLRVIAVGGDKLARGLTLEGLTTSYFLRASKMYDTLMQMGRWFGYRPNYLDLTRIYTTHELVEWFGHIADAASELREEFDEMALTGAKPRQFGLKVQSHDVLLVTSQVKMHSARSLQVSFSGRVVQTVSLASYATQRNWDAVVRLVQAARNSPMDATAGNRIRPDPKSSVTIWEGIGYAAITDFLVSFVTHPAAYRVNGPLLAEFVQLMASHGELTKWTVVIAGKGSGSTREVAPGLIVSPVTRNGEVAGDRFSIGTLLDPKDELYGMSEAQWDAAVVETSRRAKEKAKKNGDAAPTTIVDAPSGPAARYVRGMGSPGVRPEPERGVIVIYAIEPVSPADEPIPGFVLSFPDSGRGARVEYKMNNVMWETDYATA